MNEILYMVLAFAGGVALGTLFFGGLWLTTKKAVTAKMPALWFSVSFFFRIGITLIGFYFISLGSWQRLLICLLGFVTARYIVFHLTKTDEAKQSQLKKEVSHET
ncbi:MAG: ATP synthase subunit I [Saprospiraceae bacterium]